MTPIPKIAPIMTVSNIRRRPPAKSNNVIAPSPSNTACAVERPNSSCAPSTIPVNSATSVAIAAPWNVAQKAPEYRGQRRAIRVAKSLPLAIVTRVTAIWRTIAIAFASKIAHKSVKRYEPAARSEAQFPGSM